MKTGERKWLHWGRMSAVLEGGAGKGGAINFKEPLKNLLSKAQSFPKLHLCNCGNTPEVPELTAWSRLLSSSDLGAVSFGAFPSCALPVESDRGSSVTLGTHRQPALRSIRPSRSVRVRLLSAIWTLS